MTSPSKVKRFHSQKRDSDSKFKFETPKGFTGKEESPKIVQKDSRTITKVTDFDDILHTPEEISNELIPRTISFFIFINPISGDKLGERLTKFKLEEFKLKREEYETLLYTQSINEIRIQVANLKDDISRIKLMDKIATSSEMKDKSHKVNNYVLILGGDGTANQVVQELKDFQPDFSKIAFGMFPYGNYNNLSKSLGFSKGLRREITKKRRLKKITNKEMLETYFGNLAIITLKGELEELDVWEVEVECDRKGAIQGVTRNKYAGNKLETLMEKSKEVKIAKKISDRKTGLFMKKKKYSKEEPYFKNKLVHKFAEKLQNDIVNELDIEDKKRDSKVANMMEKLKLDKVVTGKERNKTSFKKIMLCHTLMGEEAKRGLKDELDNSKKHLIPGKNLINKVKGLKKIFKGEGNLNNLIKKLEISRGMGCTQYEEVNTDSILEDLEVKTVSSNILEMAENYKNLLKMREEIEEEQEERKNLDWNFLTRTIFENDEKKNKFNGNPENLLFSNIDSFKNEKKSLWQKASKISPICKGTKQTVVVDNEGSKKNDGKLELICYKKKKGIGANISRISQSKKFLN